MSLCLAGIFHTPTCVCGLLSCHLHPGEDLFPSSLLISKPGTGRKSGSSLVQLHPSQDVCVLFLKLHLLSFLNIVTYISKESVIWLKAVNSNIDSLDCRISFLPRCGFGSAFYRLNLFVPCQCRNPFSACVLHLICIFCIFINGMPIL